MCLKITALLLIETHNLCMAQERGGGVGEGAEEEEEATPDILLGTHTRGGTASRTPKSSPSSISLNVLVILISGTETEQGDSIYEC